MLPFLLGGRDDKALGTLPLTRKGIGIKPNSVVTMVFGSLVPAQNVRATNIDDNGNSVGEPLLFTVDRSVSIGK